MLTTDAEKNRDPWIELSITEPRIEEICRNCRRGCEGLNRESMLRS